MLPRIEKALDSLHIQTEGREIIQSKNRREPWGVDSVLIPNLYGFGSNNMANVL